uniref:Secretory carrier-associated membrane protein n=1 Tax=Meleagris gallopavo TaxID=9103 RepID=A0A803XRT6_MELGA
MAVYKQDSRTRGMAGSGGRAAFSWLSGGSSAQRGCGSPSIPGGLLKRQEELNRKAEELDRRERELQNAALGGGAGERQQLAPLPSCCPVKPCFYQDIPVEIPADFQKTVTAMYYLWMGHTVALLLNFLSSLAWFCVDPSSGSGFGLSILWALLYTPCSFVCWYRPMYKAFRCCGVTSVQLSVPKGSPKTGGEAALGKGR